MRAHGVVAEAAQEGAARHAEGLANAIQSGQLGWVEQHLDGFGAGCWVEAHGVSPWWCGLRGRPAGRGDAGQMPMCNFFLNKKAAD
jgi:hypothetical protein